MPSSLRIAIGFVYMAVATFAHALILIVLLPSRNLRIRSCNYWGKITGPFVLKLAGTTVEVVGRERLDAQRPAIYISNHTSALDIFLGIWLGPVGVVGVAKKEVVYYPFFGQLYWMSGHLRIDRGHHGRAVEAMAELVRIVRLHKLSIWMWPEGTRSKDGRLLPFRKGLWHLAIQTGLPVVPVIVSGAHNVWEKGTTRIRPSDVSVTVLPAIDTSDWSERDIHEVLDELTAQFTVHLPADQQPVAQAA